MQPQNFPRVHDPDEVEATLAILRQPLTPEEACDEIALFIGEPMAALSRCLRAMIIAAPGKRLLGADYSNIEGRVNAWLAGETWKVEAFRAYDEGRGDDLYKLSYASAFAIAVADVTKDQRQIGKVMELSLGYQGGWRAFTKMAANYGVSVGQDRAEELKRAWRDAHPMIAQSWWDLQAAAIDAVFNPGLTVPVLQGRVRYKVQHGFLWCLLPSGRTLCYAAPRIVWVVRDGNFAARGTFHDQKEAEAEITPARQEKGWSVRPQVEFDGVDSTTKKWGPHQLYGGLQCENIVQAIARDILVDAMLRLEDAGYPIVLTVHDEIIAEVDDGVGSKAEFESLMAVVPSWAEGLPVAVEGWEGTRYAK
jgi:DNA polymerase